MDEESLKIHVIQVLKIEKERLDRFMSVEDLDCMLSTDNNDQSTRKSIVGYPSYPLYGTLSSMLYLWMKTKHCPALDLPKFDLMDEKSYAEAREGTIKSITPLLEGLDTLASLWTDLEIQYRVRDVLLLLGRRGILDLLGIRKTVGTKEMFPPPRLKLMSSFTEEHTPKAVLSVGARALSKHFHRDGSTSWWGNCTGTDKEKNQHAQGLVKNILDNAVWINIHWLPHDVFIIEARQDQGYGARWSADGKSFRGFLEPQMIGGHEVGWRH